MTDNMTPPDPHRGPVGAAAWEADAVARTVGKVEIFNATRPDGLDGWTMPIGRYLLLRQHILESIDRGAPPGSAVLGNVIESAKGRFSSSPLFRHARVRNLALYVALDLQARCEIEALPRGRSAHLRRFTPVSDPGGTEIADSDAGSGSRDQLLWTSSVGADAI